VIVKVRIMMSPEISKNYVQKLDLLLQELLKILKQDVETMLRTRAAAHDLKSGNTVHEAIGLIEKSHKGLFQEVLGHLSDLKPKYNSQLEAEIKNLVKECHQSFKLDALKDLKRVTDAVGDSFVCKEAFKRVELALEDNWTRFINSLNVEVVNLRRDRFWCCVRLITFGAGILGVAMKVLLLL